MGVIDDRPGTGDSAKSIHTSSVTSSDQNVRLDVAEVVVRLGVGFVFLFALFGGMAGWYMVGGAGHFDVTAWYWKLVLPGAFAWSVARFMFASLTQRNPWNRTSARWATAAFTIMIVMGAVTYYYHLMEPLDENSVEEGTSSQL
jgi:hypothetical protein